MPCLLRFFFSKLKSTTEKDIALALIYQATVQQMLDETKVKELRNDIQNHTVIKLDNFKSMEDVSLYVDAIVSSGSSE